MDKKPGGNGQDQKKENPNKEPLIAVPVSLVKGMADYVQQVPTGSFNAQVVIQLVGRLQMAVAQHGYQLNGPGEPVTKLNPASFDLSLLQGGQNKEKAPPKE